MRTRASTRDYGFALLFIASLIIVAGLFGEPVPALGLLIPVAFLCAVAGYGVLKEWAWAKWLALAWGPIVVVVGIFAYWSVNRPISVFEYAAGVIFAIAWVWDANRRLAPRSPSRA